MAPGSQPSTLSTRLQAKRVYIKACIGVIYWCVYRYRCIYRYRCKGVLSPRCPCWSTGSVRERPGGATAAPPSQCLLWPGWAVRRRTALLPWRRPRSPRAPRGRWRGERRRDRQLPDPQPCSPVPGPVLEEDSAPCVSPCVQQAPPAPSKAQCGPRCVPPGPPAPPCPLAPVPDPPPPLWPVPGYQPVWGCLLLPPPPRGPEKPSTVHFLSLKQAPPPWRHPPPFPTDPAHPAPGHAPSAAHRLSVSPGPRPLPHHWLPGWLWLRPQEVALAVHTGGRNRTPKTAGLFKRLKRRRETQSCKETFCENTDVIRCFSPNSLALSELKTIFTVSFLSFPTCG
ncbi:histone-lysine N-methyltransferase SETD1A-like [Conger conger]|uniref:histone-lysine N-methyltransferase SETD1A-like n=1 Tax=Conger conger TaxID=82655 RepID=UPI002A5A710C|nr:histone-lysine N-methyltransferase SETD1A-like [Conger conger]